MDRTGIFILVVSVLLLLFGGTLVDKLMPPPSVSSTNQPNTNAGGTNGPATNLSSTNLPATNQPNTNQPSTNTPPATTNAPATNQPPPAPKTPEKTLKLQNDKAIYTFTSRGGGIKSIALKDHPLTTSCGKGTKTDELVTLHQGSPLPLLAMQSTNALFRLSGLEDFQLEQVGTNTVTATATNLGGRLKVVKTFQLNAGYLMTNVTVRLENTGAQALQVPELDYVLGYTTEVGSQDGKKSDAQSLSLHAIYWGTTQGDFTDWEPGDFANSTLGCFPGTPIPHFTGGDNNVRWTAANNQFFTTAVILPTNQPPAARVRASWHNFNSENKDLSARNNFLVTGRFPLTLNAAGTTNAAGRLSLALYTGPREYDAVEAIGARYQTNLKDLMDLDGFFGFFSKLLLFSMKWLAGLGLSYGLAIIAITFVLKAIFWPLTASSTRSMKRMAKLQPQMKALQDRYKDDQRKMQMKLMEFMKEHKVNPMGSCLPMLVQIPVFIGFFFMMRSAVELRGEEFLWACDLSQPDTIFTIPGITFIPFFSNADGFPINLLAILMGVTMFIQARLTPASPGVDPTQAKIMKYMPLMFIVFFYNFASGLTLYWTVQNVLGIVQTKMTKTDDGPAPEPVNTQKQKPRKPKRR